MKIKTIYIALETTLKGHGYDPQNIQRITVEWNKDGIPTIRIDVKVPD